MIDYADFVSRLNAKVKSDEDFYVELLKTVIKSPHRYTGIFRLTNAKTKLIQNVTQSREIKFGDFMEEIVTEYIALMGYHNLDKNIGNDDAGNTLSADQVFEKGNGIYLIEQKIRDDHDSTKKRGQFENFRKKYTLLKSKYPHRKIIASMWFIDLRTFFLLSDTLIIKKDVSHKTDFSMFLDFNIASCGQLHRLV